MSVLRVYNTYSVNIIYTALPQVACHNLDSASCLWGLLGYKVQRSVNSLMIKQPQKEMIVFLGYWLFGVLEI